jgi:RNA polymerase sigma-70 factor, ECF subfamily
MSKTKEQIEQFVRQLTGCQTRLHAYILMLLPDHDSAADVLQETNLVLWRKCDEFVEGTEFGAWACRIAYFQVLAWLRDARRDRHVFDPELLLSLSDEATKLTDQVDDSHRALRQCMMELTDRERAILGFRYDQGRSINEIAKDVGQTSGAVATMLYRIRNELLLCIQKKLKDDEDTAADPIGPVPHIVSGKGRGRP